MHPSLILRPTGMKNLLEYLFGSIGCGLPKMDFFQVFWPAWKKAMTVANIQAGFRQTGIYPVNPNAKNPALPGLSRATDNIANLSDEGKDNVLWIVMFQLTIALC